MALDQHGTIAAASADLHLTASGISMQLRALEREVGVPLTERQGRRLALTPAGRLLVEHGRAVAERLSLAELEVESLRRGAAGRYPVAAYPSFARTVLADAWRSLLDDGAGIELLLTTPEPEDALAALTAGEVDLALVHAYSNVPRRLPDGVDSAPVVTEPVWVAVRDDDPAGAPVIDLADLAGRPWVAPPRELTCFEMVDRACGLSGFRPRVVASSADFAAQLSLVAAGVGVALVPDLATGDVPDRVRLARPAVPVDRRTLAATRASMRADPGLGRLVGALRTAAGRRVRDVVA